jgi:hypothetical protein
MGKRGGMGGGGKGRKKGGNWGMRGKGFGSNGGGGEENGGESNSDGGGEGMNKRGEKNWQKIVKHFIPLAGIIPLMLSLLVDYTDSRLSAHLWLYLNYCNNQ